MTAQGIRVDLVIPVPHSVWRNLHERADYFVSRAIKVKRCRVEMRIVLNRKDEIPREPDSEQAVHRCKLRTTGPLHRKTASQLFDFFSGHGSPV